MKDNDKFSRKFQIEHTINRCLVSIIYGSHKQKTGS